MKPLLHGAFACRYSYRSADTAGTRATRTDLELTVTNANSSAMPPRRREEPRLKLGVICEIAFWSVTFACRTVRRRRTL
jgi:hypothetical protein